MGRWVINGIVNISFVKQQTYLYMYSLKQKFNIRLKVLLDFEEKLGILKKLTYDES
jgi:hypothetical protein